MSDILDDLEWRGILAQTTDRAELERDLAAGPMTLYCGFDPTADSLHAGNLLQLLTLRRFQLAGHRPIALAGGATGLIGDPSGRSSERDFVTREEVAARIERIKPQLERFLDFSAGSAVLANNLDWTAPLSALDYLRDVGKHFSVNVMLARESVSARLAGPGISYTEFSYMLLQAFDYLELYRRHGCRLQTGGSDQWGNIVAGLDLIRRVEGGSAHAVTTTLVTSATGEKFGKSTGGGRLWLDPALTSPYSFFQFWLNVDDRDVIRYLKIFTFLPREEVDALEQETKDRPQARAAARRLAEQLTTLVHGPEETARAEAAGRALFGQGDLGALDAATLNAALTEAPHVTLSGDLPSVVDLLVATELCASKSAARRAISEGGAYLNNDKVTAEDAVPAPEQLLHGRWLVLRRGKRNVAGVQRV